MQSFYNHLFRDTWEEIFQPIPSLKPEVNHDRPTFTHADNDRRHRRRKPAENAHYSSSDE
ncbi:MAG: hypothetical protein NC453_13400 [Muribaculum sp.]|nr:hypothetical protein [Muribaculum sp.]